MCTDAVAAMTRDYQVKASGSSAEEVERLRQIAESQFRAVNEYPLRAQGCPGGRSH